MKIRKAVIPAAGLGTRFLPATKAMPKEMLPIVDIPALQYIVEEAYRSGIEDILIITSRDKSSIEDHFDKSYELECELEKSKNYRALNLVQDISNMANIHYIRQKEALGLGQAVYYAKSFVGNEPFAVLLGDDIVDSEVPCLRQMMDVFDKYKTSILGVQKVSYDDISKYGSLSYESKDDRVYKVKDMVEKPHKDDAPSNIAILGRYIITPKIFDFLGDTAPGVGGEIQLTDALRELAQVEDMYAYNFIGRRFDVGDKLGYLEATVEFALKHSELKDKFRSYLDRLLNI